MKKFKASLAALLAVCSLLGLAGCSEKREQSPNSAGNSQSTSSAEKSSAVSSANSSSGTPESETQSSAFADNDNSKETSSSSEVPESSSSQAPEKKPDGGNENKTQDLSDKLSNSNTENSVRLFDKISADMGNAMFSPLSLNMALGLLEIGARGDTKSQLDFYLQKQDYADFAEMYIRRAAYDLTKDEIKDEYSFYPRSTVELANSFWANNGLPLKDAYKKTVSDKFGAEIQNVDFGNSEETLAKINGWVNEKTHGMIPKILEECGENTEAVLINTVYFESPWEYNEWYVSEDNKGSFTLLDGSKNEVQYMQSYGDHYFENGSAEAFSREYDNGLEFIGILPKKSGDFTLESLDIPSLLLRRTDRYDVTAKMPRLNFESTFQLNDALKELGIEDMFQNADFSDISDFPLKVTDVLQNTKIELDENGTKAAAVTAAALTGGGAPEPREKKNVTLDRSFAFLIYDRDAGQILFMGKVTEVEK